jgi:uncharacterized membrane protein
MNFIIKHFLRGVVIVVPIALTVYVVYQTFITIDRLNPFPYPGAGVAITIATIFLVGVLASNIIGRTLFQWTESLFIRAPFVKIIYGAIKDLIGAFAGDRRRFGRPVMVRLPGLLDAKMLGFVTREDLAFVGLEGHVAVYFPQSYNVAGNLFLIPAQHVTPIDVENAKLMTFVVSGGVSGFLTVEE